MKESSRLSNLSVTLEYLLLVCNSKSVAFSKAVVVSINKSIEKVVKSFTLVSTPTLSRDELNKWFVVGSLLLGVSGSWLGGCLFWGWLSPYPILHIPVEAVVLPLALIGLGTNWKIGSSFYISSLFGTAVTDITIFLIGIMDQWRQVITADSETAPLILQKTSENLIQIKSLSIIVFVALILWFISKEIFDSATINTTNGKALLVSSYVIQTTLIVDGIFIFLAILQPTFSGLV